MKAVVHTHYGAPDVLQVAEVPVPVPAKGEILVRVHASPVTQGDRRLRAADFPGLTMVPGRLMFGVFRPRHPIVGTMFAGRVVAVGDNVTRFAIGDDVFGSCNSGAQAEFVAMAADGGVAKIPDGVSYESAAAVPYGAGTALTIVRDVAAVQRGDKVLVNGAAGGVGRFAVQIARHLGASVTGVCRGTDADLVRSLGAEEIIDYTREDYTAGGKTYDVVVDTVSGDGFLPARRVLNPGGRYVTVYLTLRLLGQMLATRVAGNRRAIGTIVMGDQALTESVAELLHQGVIEPVISARYPLSRVAEAHAAVDHGRTGGDVLVLIDETPRGDTARSSSAVA